MWILDFFGLAMKTIASVSSHHFFAYFFQFYAALAVLHLCFRIFWQLRRDANNGK